MGIELEHIFGLRAGAGALVVLFLMSLTQLSGYRSNGKYRKRPVKRSETRKQ